MTQLLIWLQINGKFGAGTVTNATNVITWTTALPSITASYPSAKAFGTAEKSSK